MALRNVAQRSGSKLQELQTAGDMADALDAMSIILWSLRKTMGDALVDRLFTLRMREVRLLVSDPPTPLLERLQPLQCRAHPVCNEYISRISSHASLSCLLALFRRPTPVRDAAPRTALPCIARRTCTPTT